MDIRALVTAWLAKQSDEVRSKISQFIDDMFYKYAFHVAEVENLIFARALDWVLQDSSFVVETTKVGLVLNGLSHLHSVTRKGDFVLGLIRGLGGNLSIGILVLFSYVEITYSIRRKKKRSRKRSFYLGKRKSSRSQKTVKLLL